MLGVSVSRCSIAQRAGPDRSTSVKHSTDGPRNETFKSDHVFRDRSLQFPQRPELCRHHLSTNAMRYWADFLIIESCFSGRGHDNTATAA